MGQIKNIKLHIVTDIKNVYIELMQMEISAGNILSAQKTVQQFSVLP